MGKVIMMMFTVLLLALGLAHPASAAILTDTTKFTATGTTDAGGVANGDLDGYGGPSVNWLSGTGDYVAWTHHYVFDPPSQNILSGSLALTFFDDETDGKWWQVSTFELGIGRGEDWTIDFGEVDTETYTYSLNIAYLGDGSYSAKVMSLWGDFGINQSVLTITYNPVPVNGNNNAVPEPSTILLLGSGLLGVAVLGGKRSK